MQDNTSEEPRPLLYHPCKMENIILDRNSSEADLGSLQRTAQELQIWLARTRNSVWQKYGT